MRNRPLFASAGWMNLWIRAIMLAVGLVLGVGIGAQTRTALAIRTHFDVPPPHLEELAYRLRQRERAREALEAQVHELRNRLSAYQRVAAEQQRGLKALNEELVRLKMFAGLTAMEGPGVIIELRDSLRPLLLGENPNEVILHNFDIAVVVNDLWGAGAEAMAVNGERLVATTGIRSVSATLMVNERRIVPPIQILAIGDPDRLADHLLRRGGPLELLRALTFPVRVMRASQLAVPAYRGTFPAGIHGTSRRE